MSTNDRDEYRQLADRLFGGEPEAKTSSDSGNNVPREGNNPRTRDRYSPDREWLEDLFNPPRPE